MALRRRGALSIEQTNSLIDYVKSYPCIWDQDHEHYVQRNVIAHAWTEISKLTQLPEDVIRAKWKNLRDMFMRELKRTNVSSAVDYYGKWKHFKTLWFLYREDTTEQLSEDDSSDVTDVRTDLPYLTEDLEPSPEPYIVKIEPTQANSNEFTYLDTEQETNHALTEKRKQLDKNSKSDRDDRSDMLLEGVKRKRINQVYTDEDCDMMFLMSLTPYFKLIKPIRKLIVRNKIQETILKEIEQSSVQGQL